MQMDDPNAMPAAMPGSDDQSGMPAATPAPADAPAQDDWSNPAPAMPEEQPAEGGEMPAEQPADDGMGGMQQ